MLTLMARIITPSISDDAPPGEHAVVAALRDAPGTTADIIAELVKIAIQMRDDAKRYEDLGLDEDEIAFDNPIAMKDEAVLELGDYSLKTIAHELLAAVRASATIDWNLKDSVPAAIRAKVLRLLAKHDYPPDAEEKAVELVLEQAELFANGPASQ